jgi:excisionase family DNA binding protein
VTARDRPEWLGIHAAAREAGVSDDTIRRWADAGKVEAMRTGGGHRRIEAGSLHRLMHSGGTVDRQIHPTVAIAQLGADAEGWFGWTCPVSWSIEDTDRFLRQVGDGERALAELRQAATAHLDNIGG